MMNNENPISNNPSADFESLLNDFVNEERLPSESAVSISRKGCTYQVPVHDGQSQQEVLFSGSRFSWGEQSFALSQREPVRFFIGPDEKADTCFSFYLEEIVSPEETEPWTLSCYLYREGCPQPLAECSQVFPSDGYGIQIDLPVADKPLKTGRYFLLVNGLADNEAAPVMQSLGDFLCLPFRLMEKGDALVHPAVQGAEVSRPAKEQKPGFCTSGTVLLTVHFSSPLQADHLFAASCFSSNWHLVGQQERFVTQGKWNGHTLCFRFYTDRIWMPGHYTVVLTHNQEPFAAIDFDETDGGLCVTACRPLVAADWLHRWMLLLREEPMWWRIREFVGMSRLVPRLVELTRWGTYNIHCRHINRPELCENICVAIMADDAFHAKRLAYCLPKLLRCGTEERKQLDCAEWLADETPNQLLDGRANQAIVLYNLPSLCSSRGRVFLNALEKAVSNTFVFWTLTLCGTEEELDRLLAESPVLACAIRPECRLRVERPSMSEVVHGLQSELEAVSYQLEAEAEAELVRQVAAHYARIRWWRKDDYVRFVRQGILGRLKQRVHRVYDETGQVPDGKCLSKVKAADIALDEWLRQSSPSASVVSDNEGGTQAFDESMRELRGMVGLSALKESLSALFCQLRFNACRCRLGLPAEENVARHIIFTGNPGTGKTTVARLLGKIYHALGLLSQGEVIATERRELIGEYIGQTEGKMTALLQRARGNVLFIDEAYSLCTDSDDRRDFGQHVVESLLPVLTEPHPDLLVVLAGYPDEMERLLGSNPGLRSRFAYHFHFEDYTAGELMQIAHQTLERGGYRLTPEADALLQHTVEEALLHKDRYFANARWMNNLLVSGVLPAMARRVMQSDGTGDVSLYQVIERMDVETAARMQAPFRPSVPEARPRIGFRA